MNNKQQSRLESALYSIMNRFNEFRIVFGDKEYHCVGGIEHDEEFNLYVWQDFFKKCPCQPLLDTNGNFTAKELSWDEEKSVINIARTDGALKIFCHKPKDMRGDPENIFGITIPLQSENSLCNKQLFDETESREINGVKYNVSDLGKINFNYISEAFRNKMRKAFKADNYRDKTLKVFYVSDFAKKIFYMGLWDTVEHKPLTPAPFTD